MYYSDYLMSSWDPLGSMLRAPGNYGILLQ